MTTAQALLLAAACSLTVIGGVLFFAYRYWYVPRWARLRVERLRREEAAGIPPSPRDYHYAIAFDSVGLTVTDLRGRNQETFGMRWAEVCRAIAFKRDLFSVDLICLFLFCDDDTGIELDEEMARWSRLIEALPQHLPGCKSRSDWWSVVAFPPFATNETEVYDRASIERVKQTTG